MSGGMQTMAFVLRGEFITLDALLKATGLADSGGAAKALIQAGKVRVDGRDELRRGAKLRAGQVVTVPGIRVCVQPASSGGMPSDES
ncbi:RNA-binding S4 domain-containing protein [Methylibium sp.]|uniref:RNA-binding S4 domain-containing protein n=1 Tax=Methylibium sp. TaxID=2067992 RepID=UPI003D0D8CBC